jgi:inorganic triphosphatase YgiF
VVADTYTDQYMDTDAVSDIEMVDCEYNEDTKENDQNKTKSRSLREASIQKRLQAERKMVSIAITINHTSILYYIIFQLLPKQKAESQRTSGMTKYHRKAANANERERMRNLNEVFARLRNIIPDVKTLTHEDKDTKVATLRAAITYIGSLQHLMEDLDGGKVDPQDYEMVEENLGENNNKSNVIVPYKNKSVKKKIPTNIDFCTGCLRKNCV